LLLWTGLIVFVFAQCGQNPSTAHLAIYEPHTNAQSSFLPSTFKTLYWFSFWERCKWFVLFSFSFQVCTRQSPYRPISTCLGVKFVFIFTITICEFCSGLSFTL